MFSEQYLAGLNVCIEGKFSNYPTPAELKKWLTGAGATIVRRLTADVDLLLLDDDPANSAIKAAKQLNAAGAKIRVIDNLRDLVVLEPADHLALLNDSGAMERFQRLTNHPWLLRHDRSVQAHKFVKDRIAGNETVRLNLEQFLFSDCEFDGADLSFVDFGPFTGSLANCTLSRTTFDRVSFGYVAGSQFSDVAGSELQFEYLQDSVFRKASLNGFSARRLSGCQLHDCEFRYSERSHAPSMSECSIDCCVLADITANYSYFKRVVFQYVTFKNCNFGKAYFEECELRDCTFENCSGRLFTMNGASVVANLTVTNCAFNVVEADSKHEKELQGLHSGPTLKPLSEYPFVNELATAVMASTKLNFSLAGKDKTGARVTLQMERPWWHRTDFCYASAGDTDTQVISHPNPGRTSVAARVSTHDEVVKVLLRVITGSYLTEIDTGTLTSKTSKCPLKPKELRQLIINAISEAAGIEAPDEEKIAAAQKAARTKTAELKKELLAELQAADVKAFNRRTKASRLQAHPFREASLAGLSLVGVNLSEMDLMDSDLSNSDLAKANLQAAVLRGVNLKGANLTAARLKGADLRRADLTGANLTGAGLQQTQLGNAVLSGTIFEAVKFGKDHNLCGVDLSGAILRDTKLIGCIYDRRTQFPDSVTLTDLKKMQWTDDGRPPHENVQNEKVESPIDFNEFMTRLNEITDVSRLKKVVKMLQAECFQLFSEVTSDSVAGIVKSQTDKELVYSCSLNAEGSFTCCTQNLRSCGGLRGTLCKHILVLIVGLTKSGELDPTKIDEWVNTSRMRRPQVDKDAMSEILLKYKGAEAGEIDWRPTETVPEDFFAF